MKNRLFSLKHAS